jgi:hypothetical protein
VIADKYPRDDLLFRHRAEAGAVHRARGGGEVRLQPPAAFYSPGGALDQLKARALRVPGEHDLARANPPSPYGEQPVAVAQRGQHGVLGDLDAQQRPALGADVHV